jgi:hypothetical protein
MCRFESNQGHFYLPEKWFLKVIVKITINNFKFEVKKMGQYYKPINIEDNKWLYSHDYGNGLKLMEHSWVGNDFVGAVMKLLSPGQPWYKKPIVWAGDYYGEDIEDIEDNTDLEEGKEINYYFRCDDNNKIKPLGIMSPEEQKRALIVNHTTKEYVRCGCCPEGSKGRWNEGMQVHPLPLLTALGNGRGGGDYYEQYPDYDKVGSWAECEISVEFEIPDGYTELIMGFIEETD